jgi:hypothetical protein
MPTQRRPNIQRLHPGLAGAIVGHASPSQPPAENHPRRNARVRTLAGSILIYCSDYHCSHWTAISAKGLINLVLWLGIFQEVVVRKSPRYCRD